MPNSFVINQNAKPATYDEACRAYLGMSMDNLVKHIQIYGVDHLMDKMKAEQAARSVSGNTKVV